MIYVFPALERKFNGDRRLVRVGRRLYHGLAGGNLKSVREHVDVTCTGIDHEFDTFDTDEPVYDLAFTIKTYGPKPDKAATIMRELQRVMDDGVLTSGDFDTCSLRCVGGNGPTLTPEGVYEATVDYRLHVSLKSKSPAIRMA